MKKQIRKFCRHPNISSFQSLTPALKEELIKTSFDVLYQKTGDQDKALEILQTIGQIKTVHGYHVYSSDFDLRDPIKELGRIGVTTLPIIPVDKLMKAQKRFDDTLISFPEYNRDPVDKTLNSVGDQIVYVLGGFAALGNPASFHNPFVRETRIKCWEKTIQMFHDYINGYHDDELRSEYKIEVLFDRMMFRRKGQKAVAEAWHRDVMPTKLILQTDEIFGGWINLDTNDQYFSCIPGSHLGIVQRNIPSGFDTMEKREGQKIRKKFATEFVKKKMKKKEIDAFVKKLVKERMNEVGKYKHKFKVPPGHMIIFPQYIMHEVVANAVKHDMRRLFLGWRMTTSNKSLRDNDKMMREQSVVPLPGGMIPPMYSANHGSCFLGIPTVNKLTKLQKKNFDVNKWSTELSAKYLILYPSTKMRKLAKKLSAAKKSEKRSIIASMNKEYLSQPDIGVTFDKQQFVADTDYTIGLSVFKTLPTNQNSLTTLIKWSKDNMNPETLVDKNYRGNEGKYYIVKRHMDSLRKYGFKMYKSYSSQEKIIYNPNSVN
jgi:hypothetical protein